MVKISLLILLCLTFIFCNTSFSQQRTKPNVVVIFTDDHRYSGVHAFGNEQIQTPNIDKLSEEGVSFSNAYLMGAFNPATCIPSRANLLSGRNLFELKGDGRTIPPEHTTMGEAFKNAGYHCHIIGKWHQDRASLFRSFHSGGPIMGLGLYLVDQYRMPLWDWDEQGRFDMKDAFLLNYDANNVIKRSPITGREQKSPIGTENDGPHTSEIFANEAVSFIEQYSQDNPFFMYLAFHAPHDPRQAPQKYKTMYPEDEILLPPSYMPQHPFDNGEQIIRDEQLAPWPRSPEIVKKHISDYYAIITHMDAQIGRLTDALKKSGQYENTIIVFAGDSGLGVGSHGLMGKQNLYDEAGIHVPFIISGHLLKQKNKSFDGLCYIHDIFPTLADLAGISVPESVTGISLKPVVYGLQPQQPRTYAYHAYMQFQRAFRQGDYKLIEYVKIPETREDGTLIWKGSRVTQLFNLSHDPWEIHNLAYLPGYDQILKEMREKLIHTASLYGDSENDFWHFYNSADEVFKR
ncbi:MAG: sulfatase-like hydrolase/transferase [Cyclobacteriaceae bacterium]|nr:sulfatase-like hydrolase/transferase [Cyclobacteriaceae bacterium]